MSLALLVLCLSAPTWLRSQTISGVIQDTTGAVIPGARIEITGADLTQPVVLSSDAIGKFASPDLKPGTYSVRVLLNGFEPLTKTVDLQKSVELQLTLAIAKQQVNIASLTMSAVSSTFRAHYSMHSEKSAISLSLKMCPSNQSPLAISVQVWNSVRPMHLFDRNLDHDS